MQPSRRIFLFGSVALGACSAIDAIGPRSGGVAQTVLGPLDASRLGFTLSHEHVAEGAGVLSRWPSAWGGRTELVARAVDALRRVRAAGVGAIVDLTTYDVGRDAAFLAEVSRGSGIIMIAATGQRFFPPSSESGVEMPSRTIEGLHGFFRREIEEGIGDTGVKAGVIKIGIAAAQPTELEEIGLRAAALASKATGVPIRIHTAAARRAGESIAVVLEGEHLDPARVCFDHSDDSGEMDYFLGLVRRGYSLSMDHVHRGLTREPSFERRAECIKLLVDAGYADKIFLSQDTELGGWLLPGEAKTWRERAPWDPPEGLLFVTERLIPHLEQIGVSDQSINTITVEHPRAFFGRV